MTHIAIPLSALYANENLSVVSILNLIFIDDILIAYQRLSLIVELKANCMLTMYLKL